LAKAPQVQVARGAQALKGSSERLEVRGIGIDVGQDAIDVDIAELEENAHRLRCAVGRTSYRELDTSQCRYVRIAAAIDKHLRCYGLASRFILNDKPNQT